MTAFDYSQVGVQKTKDNVERNAVAVAVFRADVNEYVPDMNYDIVFSSGTLQYLLPYKRKHFIENIQSKTNSNGLHVLHTFVQKPYIEKELASSADFRPET